MKAFWYWFIIILLMGFALFCFNIAFPELNTQQSVALIFAVECTAAFIYLMFKDLDD